MKFAASGDFDGTAEHGLYALGKCLTRIARIGQHILDFRESGFVQAECGKRSGPVGDVGGRDVNRVREALRIDGEMAFDARDQLPPIIAFLFGGIRVLDALRINDDEAGLFGPTIALSHRASHIFLRHLPRN